MNGQISQLIEKLSQCISNTDYEDGLNFSNYLHELLACSAKPSDYVTGLPSKQVILCISSALQYTAEKTSDDLFHGQLWNPLIAILMKCIERMSVQENTFINKKHITQKQSFTPKKHKKISNSRSDEKVGKSVDNQRSSRSQENVSSLSTSVTVVAKATPQVEISPPKQVPLSPTTKESISSELSRDDKIVFHLQKRNAKHKTSVDCKIRGCMVCLQHAKRIPLTRCSDIKCHLPGKCHDSGWYAHISPGMWAGIRKAHKDPNLNIVLGSIPLIDFVSCINDTGIENVPSTSHTSVRKRKWTLGRTECPSPTSSSDVESAKSACLSPLTDWNDME